MKMTLPVGVLACVALSAGALFAQQVRFSPFSADESELVREIIAIRRESPQTTAEQLVLKSNEMLAKTGIEYYLQISRATCDKLSAERAKDPKRKVRLLANLQSVGGEKAKLAVPDSLFEVGGCSGCFLKLAVLEMTADTFVTRVQGYNIRFALPGDIAATQVQLVDPANEGNILSTWRVPMRWVPIGVSYDQNVIYLGFDDPSLKDIALAVFTEGTFEFTTRKEAEASGKPVDMAISDTDKSSGLARREFNSWKKRFVVRYPVDCASQTR